VVYAELVTNSLKNNILLTGSPDQSSLWTHYWMAERTHMYGT